MRNRLALDLVGQSFGLLTVLRRVGRVGKHVTWACQCECGSEIEAQAGPLVAGKRRYCDRMVHKDMWVKPADPGLPQKVHPLTWRSWQSMRGRCKYERDEKAWRNYGGRGILVCDRWNANFWAFMSDMGARPSPGHTIERLDVNGHYEPGNCIWATREVQAMNRRDTVWVEWNGERRKLMEVARAEGWDLRVVRSRLLLGWPLKRALDEPIVRYDKGPKPVKEKRSSRKSAVVLASIAVIREGGTVKDAMRDCGATKGQAYAAKYYVKYGQFT